MFSNRKLIERLGYKILDVSKEIRFEDDIYFNQAIKKITGYIFSNPIVIKIKNPRIREIFIGNDTREKEFQSILRNLSIQAIKKIMIYGFVSYRLNPEKPIEIKTINYVTLIRT